MSPAPTRLGHLLRNFLFLASGRFIGDILTLGLFVVLSRSFGVEGVGLYSFAIAFTGIFSVFAEFGFYYLTIRKINISAQDELAVILTARLTLVTIVASVLLVVLVYGPFSMEGKLVLGFIGAFQIGYTLVNGLAAVFVAREETHLAAGIEVSCRAAGALVAGGLAVAGYSLVLAVAALPAVTFCQAIIAYGILRRRLGIVFGNVTWSSFKGLLREAIPYASSAVLFQLSARIDVVLLGFMIGAAAAGIYNVAYRVIFMLQFLPYFAGLAVLPLASRLHSKGERHELNKVFKDTLNLAVIISVPAVAGLWLVAPELIALVFGEEFSESVVILRWLAVFLFLVSLKHILGAFLTACGLQAARAKAQWVGAVTSVVGNGALIPMIGVEGAALAAVIAEAVLVLLFAWKLSAVLGWPRIVTRFAMSIGGTAAAAFVITVLSPLHIAVTIPGFMAVYAGILLLFKEFRSHELAAVLQLYREGRAGTRMERDENEAVESGS